MTTQATRAIRVLVADDHTMVRVGIISMLGAVSKWAPCVVEEADTAEVAVEMARGGEYDVVLMDYQLPGTGGDRATRLIVESCPGTCVLGLSNYGERSYVERMIGAGARGYVLKNIEPDTLFTAIRTVMAGKPYYSNEVALQWMGAGMRSWGRDPLERLTRREKEVFQWALSGLRDAEIARRMFLSRRTVEKHRQNLMLKLGARNAMELVLVAQRMGMNI